MSNLTKLQTIFPAFRINEVEGTGHYHVVYRTPDTDNPFGDHLSLPVGEFVTNEDGEVECRFLDTDMVKEITCRWVENAILSPEA